MNKKLTAFALIFSGLAFRGSSVFAQSTCKLNGEVVPCGQIAEGLGRFLSIGFSFFILMIVLVIVAIIFWLTMFIHAITHHTIENRAIWIIVLIITGPIGGLVYYFLIERPFAAKSAKIATIHSTPPSPPAASSP